MFSKKYFMKSLTQISKISALITLLVLSACSAENEVQTIRTTQVNEPETHQSKSTLPKLNIYKSPTCGCCEKWLDHIDEQGFQSAAHNNNDLSSLKQSLGITPQYRSCHTAISKEGYIFEGHIPAKFIHQFLAEQQTYLAKDVLGLAVPAMPIGSPGMEVANKFMPYQVLLLKSDGSSTIYTTVNSYSEQF